MARDRLIETNGLDGDTGTSLVAPFMLSELGRKTRPHRITDPARAMLSLIAKSQKEHFGPALPDGAKADDIASVGWALVFHEEESEPVKNAMRELLAWRSHGMDKTKLFHELIYPRDCADAPAWLDRLLVRPGEFELEKIPYYLLFIGSPERIPFEVTRDLAADYCVGRLFFEGEGDYRKYLQNLLAYERGEVRTRREAVFFNPVHDEMTSLIANDLIDPLLASWNFAVRPELVRKENATKKALRELLAPAGVPSPALLFIGAHGAGYPNQPPYQIDRQGGVVCQRTETKAAPSDAIFTAGDLGAESSARGLVTFSFSCFSAGTPSHESCLRVAGQPPPRLAPKPFIARLTQALLARGALAAVGQVDRAWSCSFHDGEGRSRVETFRRALEMLNGKPVGLAANAFSGRYATKSTHLSTVLDRVGIGLRISNEDLGLLWLERNDAGATLLLGDPAVRLRPESFV